MKKVKRFIKENKTEIVVLSCLLAGGFVGGMVGTKYGFSAAKELEKGVSFIKWRPKGPGAQYSLEEIKSILDKNQTDALYAIVKETQNNIYTLISLNDSELII